MRRTPARFLVLPLLLMLLRESHAQVSVDLTVPGTSVLTIGDHATLELDVQAPAGTTFLSHPHTLLTTAILDSGLTLFDHSTRSRPAGPERMDQIVSVEVTAFSTGSFTIPALTIGYALKDTTRGSLSTRPLTLTVRSILDPKNPGDILGPLGPAEFYARVPRVWIVTVTITLLGLLLAVYFLRRPPVVMRPPPRPAYDEAVERLNQLMAEELPRRGQTKEHLDRLSDLIRQYMVRLAIVRMDRTTTELFEDLKEKTMPLGAKEELERILSACDQAKFAMYEPQERMLDEIAERSRAFLDLLRPHPQVAPGVAAAAGAGAGKEGAHGAP